jgi:hypothetical protein
MKLNLTQLATDMDELALQTWRKIAHGPAAGVRFREEGLTEHNLFALTATHPSLKLRYFRPDEEVKNGADWEWWIGSDTSGWIGLRLQAKKLKAGDYATLNYRSCAETRLQAQVLVDETAADAQGRALYPLFCFYNGWAKPSGWPQGVTWTIGCAQPANCPNVPDVRVFGCALAAAADVLRALQAGPRAVQASRFLPLQRPWSWLFEPSAADPLDGLVAALRLRWPGVGDPVNRPRFEELPPYAQLLRDASANEDDLRGSADAVPTAAVLVADVDAD